MDTSVRRRSADLLFTILLLIMFALFSFFLAGIGAAVYRRSADQLNENYTSRTAAAYITEKIRQCSAAGAVSFGEVEDCPAIILRTEYENTESGGTDAFLTYIYYWDGTLRELFAREDTPVTVSMGSSLVELSDFSFSFEDPLLSVTTVSPDGEKFCVLLDLAR